jgi:N6-L-threonylcarbamoyladenine synthase
MTRAVIGLDTSCYTTSCAAVTTEGEVIASCRQFLPVKAGERGLRQSEAVFAHVRQLPALMEQLGERLRGAEIAAVCASRTPRDAEDSYMPVFQVGDAQARSLAAVLGVPCFASTHQRGHIYAARVDSGIAPGDLLAVHLSGGTTEVLSLRCEALTLLGGTADLHAGQLVDRAGVAMGLPFPAGPHLEELARKGTSAAKLPISMEKDTLSAHLSGAETQVQRWIRAGAMPREDIAREIYDFLARTVCRLVCGAAEQTGITQALIAGGVASSPLFRGMMTDRAAKRMPGLRICFGKPEYSGDNAVGAALIGAEKWRKQHDLHDD